MRTFSIMVAVLPCSYRRRISHRVIEHEVHRLSRCLLSLPMKVQARKRFEQLIKACNASVANFAKGSAKLVFSAVFYAAVPGKLRTCTDVAVTFSSQQLFRDREQ